MIKEFLAHHQRRANRGEITNCLKNCHVKGIHSVMLNDEPGNRIRMFYATKEHELWKNGYWGLGGYLVIDDEMPMSLGIHRHHCDVTLRNVFGSVCNSTFSEPLPCKGTGLTACTYKSGVEYAKGCLDPLPGKWRLEQLTWGTLHSTFLKSNELHTIWLKQGNSAAWIVIEGKEDVLHNGICYTNNPRFSSEGLYEKASKDDIIELFAEVMVQI